MRPELLALSRMDSETAEFKDLYEKMFETFADKTFLEYKENGEIKIITYKHFADMVKDTARKLSYELCSLPASSYIALKYENSPKWLQIFWALLMCGKNVLLIDNKNEKQITETLMAIANVRAIICGKNDTCEYSISKFVFEDIEANGKADPNFEPNWANRIALCTSGTTATSKVYAYNAASFVRFFKEAETLYNRYDKIFLDGNDKCLVMLPLNHVFGFTTTMWMSSLGNAIIFPKNNTPQEIFLSCREHSVTWLFSVPVVWNRIAELIEANSDLPKEALMEKVENSIILQEQNSHLSVNWLKENCLQGLTDLINCPKLRITINGGGPIPEKTLKIINALGYGLMNGYGSTEAGMVSLCATSNIRQRLSGSIGVPFSAVEARIKENSGNAETKTGELLLKTTLMHCERILDGKCVVQEVDADGWYHTGDLAQIENGVVTLMGREKSVIINESGENIYPEELELYFSYLPYCLRTDAVGIKDPSQNEQVTLILHLSCALDDDEKINELISAFNELNNKLPVYKMVKYLYAEQDVSNLDKIKSKKSEIKKQVEENSGRFQKIQFFKSAQIEQENEIVAEETVDACKNDEELRTVLKRIISGAVNQPAEKIPDNENIVEYFGISSITLMEIFVDIEDTYKITIPSVDYNKYLTVNKIIKKVLEQQHKVA